RLIDRLKGEEIQGVKKALLYGQVGRRRDQSCQESPVILTGWKEKRPKLSRKPRYFDRLEGEEAKAVKKAPLF
ncbi:hypothetical protein J7E34_07445, partial [Chryseobacterium sp. ISL-80]|nr:hypothetical protein [Chryseobacterium sp. ISL-80]